MKPGSSFNRSDFDWYWQPPFCDSDSPDYFDREHWWAKATETVTEESRWYELLRRHPITRFLLSLRSEDLEARNTSLRHFLRLFGTCSWVKLVEGSRQWFAETLKDSEFRKGRDHRPAVIDLSAKAQSTVTTAFIHQWNALLQEKPHLGQNKSGQRELQWEASVRLIKELASDEFRSGKLIIAVRKDVADLNQLGDEIQKAYEDWRKTNRVAEPKPGRNRSADWLSIIQAFEESEHDRLFDARGKVRKKAHLRKTNEPKRHAFQKLFSGIRP